MSVNDLCSRSVVCVEVAQSAAQAARLMRDHHVGSVVVVDTHQDVRRPVGMITDRDIALRLAASSLDAANTPVGLVMTPRPFTVEAGDSVRDAIEVRRATGVRRLPVVDASGGRVGLLSADDLIALFGSELWSLSAMVQKGMRQEIRFSSPDEHRHIRAG